MPLDTSVVGRTSQPVEVAWTSSQALLYALGVGAGSLREMAQAELPFTTENSHGVAQRVLPTFPVVVGAGYAGPEQTTGPSVLGNVDMTQVLHGEQSVTLHGGLPCDGRGTTTSTVTGIRDTGRHAVVDSVQTLRDAEGAVLAVSSSAVVVRGAGGFGGDPGSPSTWTVPDRPHDEVVVHPTRPEQALLYRLSGDRNPLHADPWFARKAGFERPILHGLCTFGIAGRAVLHHCCGGDPDRFGFISARFAAPVVPGDTVRIRVWRTAEGAVFQALVDDRVVLDRGVFRRRRHPLRPDRPDQPVAAPDDHDRTRR